MLFGFKSKPQCPVVDLRPNHIIIFSEAWVQIIINKIGKLNVDTDNQVAAKYGVRSIPALLIFKDGSVANQIVGAVPKEKITELLDSVI